MVDIPDVTEESGSAFNVAINTLMRISNIIERIGLLSCGISNDKILIRAEELGEYQYLKYRLIKELYIQSIPLLNKTKADEIHLRLTKVRETLPKIKKYFDSMGRETQNVIKANLNIDIELDEINILIQRTLADDGYFMPKKDDPRHSWRR